MGAALIPFIMGLFDAIGSVLGAGISAAQNQWAVNEQNRTNRAIADANNKTSIQINDDNIALQQNENRLNRDFNAEQSELAYKRQVDMQNAQNQWNSPQELAKRYAEAGINPNVVFGNGTMQAAGGSVPSESPASYHTGLSPSLPNLTTPRMEAAPSVATGIIDSLSKIAGIDKMISDKRKTDEEATTLRETRDSIIKQLNEDVEGKHIANALQKQYGAQLMNAQIGNYTTSAMKNMASYAEAMANKDWIKAKEALTKAEKEMTDAKTKLYGEQRRQFQLSNDNFFPAFWADLKTKQAQANYLNSQSFEIQTLLNDKQANLRAQKALTDALIDKTDYERMTERERKNFIMAQAKKAYAEAYGQEWKNKFNDRNADRFDQELEWRIKNLFADEDYKRAAAESSRKNASTNRRNSNWNIFKDIADAVIPG